MQCFSICHQSRTSLPLQFGHVSYYISTSDVTALVFSLHRLRTQIDVLMIMLLSNVSTNIKSYKYGATVISMYMVKEHLIPKFQVFVSPGLKCSLVLQMYFLEACQVCEIGLSLNKTHFF